jgi:hypothetical protein
MTGATTGAAAMAGTDVAGMMAAVTGVMETTMVAAVAAMMAAAADGMIVRPRATCRVTAGALAPAAPAPPHPSRMIRARTGMAVTGGRAAAMAGAAAMDAAGPTAGAVAAAEAPAPVPAW